MLQKEKMIWVFISLSLGKTLTKEKSGPPSCRASMGTVTSVESLNGNGYFRQEPQREQLLPSSEGLLSARLGFPHGSTGITSCNPNSDSVKEDLPSPLA